MSNFVGKRPNPLAAAIQGAVKLFGKKQKTTGTGAITTTNISKNLKKFQEHKEDVIKTTDKHTKGLTEEGKTNVRKFVAPALSKISKITQQLPEKKAKGGRIGYKLGSPKKSKLKKIQEAFKPTQSFMVKKEKPKKRLMAKKGSPDPKKKKKKFPDLTGDGKVTFADILKGRGVINGKKNKTKKKII